MGQEPGIGPAQLTCPDTDADHSDQSVPVLFVPLLLEVIFYPSGQGRLAPTHPATGVRGGSAHLSSLAMILIGPPTVLVQG